MAAIVVSVRVVRVLVGMGNGRGVVSAHGMRRTSGRIVADAYGPHANGRHDDLDSIR